MLKKIAASSVLLGALLSLGSGCSDDGESGLSSQDVANQICDLFIPCCQQLGGTGNQSTCRALFGFLPIRDEAAARHCVDDLRALAQSPDFCQQTKLQPESCDRAFPTSGGGANTPAGGSCNGDGDCQTPAEGEVSCRMPFDGNGARICQVALRGNEGDACVGTRSDVGYAVYYGDDSPATVVFCHEPALYCDAQALVCKRFLDLGEDCSGGRCDVGGYCALGVCTAQKPAGSSCADSDDACDAASYCEPIDRICRARRAGGEGCFSHENCLSNYCSADGICGKWPNPGALLFCL